MSSKQIDLAVIIPTLNEEYFIGGLLDSILKQTVTPKEVVVVDAFSKDQTVKEINKRKIKLPQIKIYKIPKYTIARQRNFGVKKTTSPRILFLDADMELKDKKTLQTYFEKIICKNPDVAASLNMPNSTYWKDKIYFIAENAIFKIAQFFWPMVTTRNLYVKRSVFEENGGFDEKVRIWEDHDLVQRLVKNGAKFSFFNSPIIYTSVRRFQKEGRRKEVFKAAKTIKYILKNGFRKIPVKYELGNFGPTK